MFSARHRFHGYGSLRGVYERGRNVRGQLISLRVAQRDPRRPYRVAVVISRKVSKSAVVRNRIRRRIYERLRAQATSIEPGTDLVFTVYSDRLAETDGAQLAAMLGELMDKARHT